MWLWLSIFLLYADRIDRIEKGQITSASNCVLCGGRILCGATDEVLRIEAFQQVQAKTIKNFCFEKSTALEKDLSNHQAWVPKEVNHFSELKDYIRKIAELKSTSRITNQRIESIDDTKLEARIMYRWKNGFSYGDLEEAAGPKNIQKLHEEGKIIPLISFEQYRSLTGKNMASYHKYSEKLIVERIDKLNTNHLAVVSLNTNNSRLPASTEEKISDVTFSKPHDFYQKSDTDSFLQKIILSPNDFCERLNYREVIAVTQKSIENLAMKYGGSSTIEKSYYNKKALASFEAARKSSPKDCPARLQSWLNNQLEDFPNPQLALDIEKIQGQNIQERGPSSRAHSQPVFCTFDINNHQYVCPKK